MIFACLNHSGCSETSSQYYSQHPEFQEFVKTQENRIKEAVGPIVIEYWAPLMWFAAGQEATTRLSTHFYFTGKPNNGMVQYKKEF